MRRGEEEKKRRGEENNMVIRDLGSLFDWQTHENVFLKVKDGPLVKVEWSAGCTEPQIDKQTCTQSV